MHLRCIKTLVFFFGFSDRVMMDTATYCTGLITISYIHRHSQCVLEVAVPKAEKSICSRLPQINECRGNPRIRTGFRVRVTGLVGMLMVRVRGLSNIMPILLCL